MQNLSANVYRPHYYPGPIALDCIPSPECDAFHKNSCIQINLSPELRKKFLMESNDRDINEVGSKT